MKKEKGIKSLKEKKKALVNLRSSKERISPETIEISTLQLEGIQIQVMKNGLIQEKIRATAIKYLGRVLVDKIELENKGQICFTSNDSYFIFFDSNWRHYSSTFPEDFKRN